MGVDPMDALVLAAAVAHSSNDVVRVQANPRELLVDDPTDVHPLLPWAMADIPEDLCGR